MTPTLAPGLLMGPAPPANAPPATTSPGGTSSKPATGADDGSPRGSFAALLTTATHRESPAGETTAKTAGQPGGETASPPPGGIPPIPEAPSDPEVLLAQLVGLMQGLTGDDASAGTADQPEDVTLLLDRLAGAGGPGEAIDGVDIDAVEALMAYLVMGAMGQPAQPEPMSVPAVPDDVLALLQRLEAAGHLDGEVQAELRGLLEQGGANAASGSAEHGDVVAQVRAVLEAQDVEGPPMDGDGTATPETDELVVAADADVAEGTPALATERSVLADGADTGSGWLEHEPQAVDPAMTAGGPRLEATTGMDSQAGVSQVAGVTSGATTSAAPGQSAAAAQPRVVDAAALPAEIADTVRVATIRGDSEVRLVLNPPELGHLDIRIASGEQGLRITLEAAQSGARDLIDRSMAGLQQALESRDLRIDRIEVRSTDTGHGSLNTSGGDQGRDSGSAGRDEGSPDWSPVASFEGPSDQSAATQTTQTVAADGSVDVLA